MRKYELNEDSTAILANFSILPDKSEDFDFKGMTQEDVDRFFQVTLTPNKDGGITLTISYIDER